MCANFQFKETTLTFSAQTCPNRKLVFEIQKTNVGIRISIIEIPYVLVFRQNGQLWIFGHKFDEKWIWGPKFQKSKSRFGINTSKIPCAPIFSKNGQFLIFRPKFRKISQLRAIFWFKYCWGVAESWVESKMSWVEVDGAGWRLKWAGWRWVHSLVIPFSFFFQ